MQRKYAGLALHDCDIEQLAHQVLNTWQRTHTTLRPHDHEDAIAYLVAVAWELSERFDAARYSSFRDYARTILALRVTDWIRRDEGRTIWKFDGHTHTRERPKPLSLDAPAVPDSGDPLGDTLTGNRGDDPADRDADGSARLLAARGRHRQRDLGVLRQAAARFDKERARNGRRKAA